MFTSIRKRISTPAGVLAVIALVLALGGTALAASGALSGKQRKEVEKIAKKFAGKPGTNGTNGAPGEKGAAGTNGTNGTNGVSVIGTTFAGNEHGCTEGGVEFKSAGATTYACNGKKGANGSNGTNGTSVTGTAFAGNENGCTEGGVEFVAASTTYACNGVKGDPGETGFTEFLPEGKTETGTWAFGRTSGIAFAPISFAIPLGKALSEEHVHYVPAGGPTPEACEGHTAAPGNLCVFEQFGENVTEFGFFFDPFAEEFGTAGTHGTVMHFYAGENAVAQGYWAVTERE